MTRDEYWREKSDSEMAEAATHLAECAQEDEITIRLELRRRGMREPPPTARPERRVGPNAVSALAPLQSSSPAVNRYRDAYRVGAALVGLGNAIKIIGAILGGIILVGSLSSATNQFGGSGIALAGVLGAAVVGGLFWVCGVVVAAQGEILRATLDTAVASSHFLSDAERADAMGLPRSVADRTVA